MESKLGQDPSHFFFMKIQSVLFAYRQTVMNLIPHSNNPGDSDMDLHGIVCLYSVQKLKKISPKPLMLTSHFKYKLLLYFR